MSQNQVQQSDAAMLDGSLVLVCLVWQLDQFHSQSNHSMVNKSKSFSNLIGNINVPATDEWAPVINPNHGASAGAGVSQPYHGAEGQGRVRSRIGRHVINLAIGGGSALKSGPIPACRPVPHLDWGDAAVGSRDGRRFKRRRKHEG